MVFCCFGLVSAGLAAFCVVLCGLNWFLLVSTGLAVFCMVLCCFGMVKSICANRTQDPGQIGHDIVLHGFAMVLYSFVLFTAGLAGFVWFWAGLGWSRCVLCGFVLFFNGLGWSRCVLFGFL